MKEAAGEANLTVITIVLIAIVLGVGTLVVSNVMKTVSERSCCNSKGGEWQQWWNFDTWGWESNCRVCYQQDSGSKMCGAPIPMDCN